MIFTEISGFQYIFQHVLFAMLANPDCQKWQNKYKNGTKTCPRSQFDTLDHPRVTPEGQK